jgi:formamidopyrimidine-DNA glycosylase
MPELPEVETTRRGIEQHLLEQTVTQVIIRQPRLRWPVTPSLRTELPGQAFVSIDRRAKYLLLRTSVGTLIIHLGMSGSLRVLAADIAAEKHDHVDIVLANGQCLRLRDPRRFGAVLWTTEAPEQHKLLLSLGPEPWDNAFNPETLYRRSRGKTVAVKNFIMDSKIVVGVGNIYASESLFLAGIRPALAAGKVSKRRYEILINNIQQVLEQALKQGGTTLRNFSNSDGMPGYFKQSLNVYGRAGEPCNLCASAIKQVTIGQRSSFYCPTCQS